MDEPCVLKKKFSRSDVVYLILYVNDILQIENNIHLLKSLNIWLSKNFCMIDIREATYIIRIKIYRDKYKRLLGLS
jgi:hypothetical protein